MLDKNTISEYVDKMAAIKKSMAAQKSEYDKIEAELLKQFELDAEDTKYKTIGYKGENALITATYADTVKLVYPSFLRNIFGSAYSDVVTEETAYKLSASAKRMLAALYKGEFVRDTTIEETISILAVDDKTKTALLKKLKGKNFETDKNNLIKFASLDEKTASDYAYLISEAAVWETFRQLLSVNGMVSEDKVSEVLNYINNAVTVEETPKITVTDIS